MDNTTNINYGSFPLSLNVLKNSRIGLWAFELDEGCPPRMYADEAMLDLLGVEGPATPEEIYHAWYDNIDADYLDVVKEAVAKMTAGIHAEVQYPWHYRDGRTAIVRCGGVRDPQYTKGLRIEGVHRDATDLVHFEKEQELLKKVKEDEKIIESFSNFYNIAVKVNMLDDSFELLRIDEGVIGFGVHFDTFTQAMDFFLTNAVFSYDKEMMKKEVSFDTIREKLKNVSTYSIKFRVMFDGKVVWHEMTVKFLDENQIAVGFAENNTKIIFQKLMKNMTEDYFALLYFDLDAEQLTVIKKSPWNNFFEENQVLNREETLKKLEDANVDERVKSYYMQLSDLNYVRQIFADEDKHSRSYISHFAGENKWVTVTCYVINRHTDGSPAGLTLGFTILDTLGVDREVLQEKLRLALNTAECANKKITEQKHYLDYFVESYSTAYFVDFTNDTFEIFHMDSKFAKIFTPNGNKVDMDRFIEQHIYHEDQALMRQISDKNYVIARLKAEKSFTFTVREVFGDEIRTMRGLVVRGFDEYHVAVGFLDITEELQIQQRKQTQLKEALLMAQSANKAKTSFLFNMSHDIRTPMNAIIGFTNMAMRDIESSDKVLNYLKKIHAASDMLLSMINDILDMSRIESGKVNLKSDKIDVVQLFREIQPIMQNLATPKDINLIFDVSNIKNKHVFAVVAYVQRILVNIISNAIKYTLPGGNVIAKLEENPSEIQGVGNYCFVITDNGIGMSEEFQKQMFEEFSREENSTVSGIQGTGLGLPLAKKLVELMGGNISCVSKQGLGSKFTIILPFKLQGEEELDSLNMSSENKVIDLSGKKVLLVDDNEFNREIGTDILEEEGMVVEVAMNGYDAVDLLKNKGPKYYDYILMDIQMPIMNGYEATIKIRKMYPNDYIPIIAVSANAFEEDKQKSLAAGMNYHIPKPIDLNKLKNVLSELIR